MAEQRLSIASVVSRDLLECSLGTCIEDAAKKMRDAKCSSIIVTISGKPVGIWTENDVLSLDFNNPQWLKTPISEVMTSPLKTIPHNTPLEEVSAHFIEEKVRHFLVTNDDHQPVGIISETDIVLRYDANHFLQEREVHTVMDHEFSRISGDSRLSDVVQKMHDSLSDAIVVEATEDSGLGIITERDIVHQVANRVTSNTACKVATIPLITVSFDTPLVTAREMMKNEDIRHLGVTNKGGELFGLLSFSEILKGIQFEYIHWLEDALEKRTRELKKSHDELELRIKERTKELQASQDQLRKLSQSVEQSPNIVFITNLEGEIEYVNPRFQEITGYTALEAIGKKPDILNSGATPLKVYKKLWETIKEGKVWRGQIKNRHKDGSNYWVFGTISPVRGTDGEISHFVAMHNDITKIKETEHAMKEALDLAEIANRAKSEILTNMSHELRTPLNAIIGFSDTLRQEIYGRLESDKQKEYINDIHNSGILLLELINDILDVSSIESNKVELHEESLHLAKVVEASVRLMKHHVEKAQTNLVVVIDNDIPMLYADERRVKQILINLLSNAVKFTPQNGNVSLEATLDDNGMIVITVKDTGIGMNETELAKAMTQFGQVDSGLSRKYEGTGLGLPLTLGFVSLHNATLDIVSEKGIGTTATVRFPKERTVAS